MFVKDVNDLLGKSFAKFPPEKKGRKRKKKKKKKKKKRRRRRRRCFEFLTTSLLE
jgi:hypothetical protein